MNKARGWLLTGCLQLLMVLGMAGTLAAEEPQPAAEALPQIRLEAHQGKTHFLLGEPMQLDLVFRNGTQDKYVLNTVLYGDLADKVEITPASGWLMWRGQSGHDYLSAQPLGAEEVRIPIVLNQGFVFREPGHYQVRVTTRRMRHGENSASIKPMAPVTTNCVDIDLETMPADLEAVRLKELLAAIHSTDARTREGGEAHRSAIAQLAALQRDEAARAKVDLILVEDGAMRQATWEALASTRNLALQLSLLEAAWSDPKQMPVYDLFSALAETRRLQRGVTTPGWTMSVAPTKTDVAEVKRTTDEAASDMKALYATLPQRSGANRAAAITCGAGAG